MRSEFRPKPRRGVDLWFCIRLQPREKARGCIFGTNLVADPKLEPLPCRIIDFSNQVADSRGHDAGKIETILLIVLILYLLGGL
jgi:hypothetical protein